MMVFKKFHLKLSLILPMPYLQPTDAKKVKNRLKHHTMPLVTPIHFHFRTYPQPIKIISCAKYMIVFKKHLRKLSLVSPTHSYYIHPLMSKRSKIT
jgi:hypothetical protein